MRTTPFLALILLAMATGGASALVQQEVDGGTLAPITGEYRGMIVRWARRYYAEPKAIGPAAISDPVLVRDGTGRLLWLVCLEIPNPPVRTMPGAPERLAFGFSPEMFSAPHERNRTTLSRTDCESRPLAYRPFGDLEEVRAAARERRKRRRPLASR